MVMNYPSERAPQIWFVPTPWGVIGPLFVVFGVFLVSLVVNLFVCLKRRSFWKIGLRKARRKGVNLDTWVVPKNS